MIRALLTIRRWLRLTRAAARPECHHRWEYTTTWTGWLVAKCPDCGTSDLA